MYSTGKLNRLKLGTQGLTPNMALCLSTAQVLLEDFDVFYQFLRKLYFFCQDIVKDCCKRNICDLGFLVPGGIRISKEFWGFPNFLRIFKVLIFSDFKVGCTWFPKLNAPRLILGIIALNKGFEKKNSSKEMNHQVVSNSRFVKDQYQTIRLQYQMTFTNAYSESLTTFNRRGRFRVTYVSRYFIHYQ